MAGLGFIFTLWFYYDRRDRRLFDEARHQRAFHCVRCGRLFSTFGGAEVAACPHCEYTNVRLKF